MTFSQAAGHEKKNGGAPVPKIGIAGCGNMGSAFVRALDRYAKEGRVALFAWNRTPARMHSLLQQGYAFTPCGTPEALAKKADMLFLCVKPPQVPGLTDLAAKTFAGDQKNDALVVSIAAGVSLARLRKAAAGRCPVARIMPTTTLAAGAGVFALVADTTVPPACLERLRQILFLAGSVYEMTEGELNAFSAAIGCAPGFIFHLVQGLVDGAVAVGISRAQACEMMVSTIAGCARLSKENAATPICALRDQVASPGGMTIQGLATLERNGVNGHIMDAIRCAYEKGMEMENSTAIR